MIIINDDDCLVATFLCKCSERTLSLGRNRHISVKEGLYRHWIFVMSKLPRQHQNYGKKGMPLEYEASEFLS